MKYIDYIFYRVFDFYKRKGDSTPIVRGCIFLTILFSFSILTVITFLSMTIDKEFKDGNSKIITVFIFVPLLILFLLRFTNEKRITTFVEKYQGEDFYEKRKRTLIIAIYTAIVIIFPIMIGILRHNFHLNI